MKKLEKLSLKELKDEMPIISENCLSQLVGGSTIDWASANDSVRISTIINAYRQGDCELDNLFSGISGSSYTSNPNGTNVVLNGKTYSVVMIVGNFNDNYGSYGYQTPNQFDNPYGTWDPINIGSNGVMRILIKEESDFDGFINYLGN